ALSRLRFASGLRSLRSCLSWSNSFPLTRLRRPQNGIRNIIRRQALSECRRCLFVGSECLQEIGELVNECMFISNLQARHPPTLHIRMIAIGHMNPSPAAHQSFVTMIEVLNSM